jgi:hypothetical protein
VDAALVKLWNELERLRLAGDQAGLAGVERAAARIAARGDEAQRREAERLLEIVRSNRAEEGEPGAATARLDAELARGHLEPEPVRAEVEPELPRGQLEPEPLRGGEAGGYTLEEAWEQPAERQQGIRLGPLIWAVVIAVVVILNVVGRLAE